MKHSVRTFSLFLCFCLLSPLLIACGGTGDVGGDTTAPPATTAAPTDTQAVDKWAVVSFPGQTLRIMYNDVVSQTVLDAGATNSYDYLCGPDDEGKLSSGVMKEAAERHERVKEKLDIDIVYPLAGWNKDVDNILPTIESLVSTADESTPDIIIHQNYGMVRAGILGHFYNALDTYEPDNYFDLTDEHWYLDMMLENTLDTSKIYMLIGDYFIDNFRMAYGLLANINIIDDVLQDEGGIESLYDTVRAGQWTYDEMLRIADAGDVDGGTPGTFEEGDIMGVIGEDGWITRTFFSTSGLDVFVRAEDGTPAYIENIDAVHDFVTKFIEMNKETYFEYGWTVARFGASATTTFINGGTVFATNQMVLSMEGSRVLDMEGNAAGMLPDPKYVKPGDEADDSANYGALVSDNANCGAILLSSQKFSLCSAFLQMMTEESDEFINQYYEVTLKYKNNPLATQGHVDMLTYIHDGICSPMSFLYDNYCAKSLGDKNVYKSYAAIMMEVINSGTNTFASKWAETLTAKQNRLTEIIGFYGVGE